MKNGLWLGGTILDLGGELRDKDKWPALHTYRRAVAMGKAPAILCPDDAVELIPIDNGDEPALMCYGCRTKFSISAQVWDQIADNIKELVRNLYED